MAAQDTYTRTARWLHWIIAGLIVTMLAYGFLMVEIPKENTSLRVLVFNGHKTVGMLILVLSLARIFWRLGHKPPPLPPGIKLWQHRASKFVHLFFYVFMIVMPLIGWAIISTSRFPSKLFNIIPLPKLPILRNYKGDERAELHDLLESVHEKLAYLAIALILLHVIAALKHHRSDGVFLSRMTLPRAKKKAK